MGIESRRCWSFLLLLLILLPSSGMAAPLESYLPMPIIGSFEPVTTFEKFCGPLLPKCDIGNTFRSELGVGYKWASIGPALR